jgi:predicted DNA-binding transcriptional regulator AlpA
MTQSSLINPQRNCLVSLNFVSEYVNLSPSTIRRLELATKFPKRRQISSRRVAFLFDEIREWAENR